MYLGSLRLLRVREFAFLQAIACTIVIYHRILDSVVGFHQSQPATYDATQI
ncbi:hypothetical protein NIES39_C03000 [Arthrospira platensis NIES-39]|uniref:hypothetical protein n=1 Tax=Limnospira platensis TaxID=118562 RepID=UPI0001D0EF81|nr:hypothetical protein NIES39_C03000 [Arthrospira platensis NIES-39]